MFKTYFRRKKEELSRPLTKDDLIWILVAICIVLLLIFLCGRVAWMNRLAKDYPYLIKCALFVVLVLAAIIYSLIKRSPRCPVCKSKYDDAILLYETGMFQCVKCGHQVPLTAVCKKDDREFLLNALLKSKTITEEEKEKIRKLKSQDEPQ
jgi:ribosomal protein L37AE/L43A